MIQIKERHQRALSTILALALVASPASGVLLAQQVFTELRDPAQVRAFQHVSNGLICQCGCNMVLSSCAHVDCPFAIPIRRFIEDRIVAGVPADEILRKMETGFGPEIETHPHVIALGSAGRADLVRGLRNGFGARVSAHTSPAIPLVIVLSFSGLAIALFSFWRRKRKPKAPSTTTAGTVPLRGPPDAKDAPQEVEDALAQLRDREK